MLNTETKKLLTSVIDQTPYNELGEEDLVEIVQVLLDCQGYEPGYVDGLFGPRTLAAIETFLNDKEESEKRIFSPPYRVKNQWPTYENIVSFYGQPGTNLVSVDLPYPHLLAWDLSKTINTVTCHKKVADSYTRILRKVLDYYGAFGVREYGLNLFGGCYSNRAMRGSSKKSTHAWGVAFDYDPLHNQFRWNKENARFARPEYNEWWDFWEQEGWVSLGRERNFDWMHIQAVKL